MNNLFVPHDIAEQLKEKGFDVNCIAYYFDESNDSSTSLYSLNIKNPNDIISKYDINAPLYQQVVDWFRETHNIHIQVAYRTYYFPNDNAWYYTFELGSKNQYWVGKFDTYYSALNCAINCAINLITTI